MSASKVLFHTSGMDTGDGQRPWLRLAISIPVLLLSTVCALAAVSGSGNTGSRQVEMMSAIDEYLEGKYGTGEAQSLGQLNKFDHTGYAGTQSVAKEFGLSDNNPLVEQFDQDSSTRTADSDSTMDSHEQSVPARAAAIVSTVFGEPQQSRTPASTPMDARETAMRVAGAKAVNSLSLAAQRTEMRAKMLGKFEAQAEASTQKVAAQTVDTMGAAVDAIGDGTVPSDRSYLDLPSHTSPAPVPALAAAAKAVAKSAAVADKASAPRAAAPADSPKTTAPKAATKPTALSTTAQTVSPVTVHAQIKTEVTTALPKAAMHKMAATSPAAIVKRTSKPAAAKAATGALQHVKKSFYSHLRDEAKMLEKEVKSKNKDTHRTQTKMAPTAAPAQSWMGLANMLDSRTPEEVQAADEQQNLSTEDDTSTSKFNLLSDPEDDLKDDPSPDGPTAGASLDEDDFGSLLTTLKKDEDPAAAAQENMYRRAETAAMNSLHPVHEIYTDSDGSSQMRSTQSVQQLRSVPLHTLHPGSDAGAQKAREQTTNTNTLATKMALLKAEVKRYREQQEVNRLEKEVASFKGGKTPMPALATRKQHVDLGEDQYLKEDEASIRSVTKQAQILKAAAPAHIHSGVAVAKADAAFEAEREHVAAREADSSEEDVARLRAQVKVMRARISSLEKIDHVKHADRQQSEDEDTDKGEALQQEKARQQLLAQFRKGALTAAISSGDFWKRKHAKEVAAKYRAEALNSGATNYDQVQELKSALQQQQQVTTYLRQELLAGVAPGVAAGSFGTQWKKNSSLPSLSQDAGVRATGSWAKGVAEVRREMKGVRRDMDETAGKEDVIVGRISEIGSRIGGYMKSSTQT